MIRNYGIVGGAVELTISWCSGEDVSGALDTGAWDEDILRALDRGGMLGDVVEVEDLMKLAVGS